MECIFCKIIKREIPSYTIFEDEIIEVFLDINAISKGHMLIVPKEHFVDLEKIPLDVLTHIQKRSKEMLILINECLKSDGVKLLQNNGHIQDVKHYHLHLIPFYLKKQKPVNLEEVYKLLKKEN